VIDPDRIQGLLGWADLHLYQLQFVLGIAERCTDVTPLERYKLAQLRVSATYDREVLRIRFSNDSDAEKEARIKGVLERRALALEALGPRPDA
jgi:hypothetical protein